MMLDRVQVKCFGSMVALTKISSVTVLSATELTVQPFDTSLSPDIESAIRNSDLKLNPINDG